MKTNFRGTNISAIHNRILKEKLNLLEKDVRRRTPEIQKEQMVREFVKVFNQLKFKERLQIIWRAIWRKL